MLSYKLTRISKTPFLGTIQEADEERDSSQLDSQLEFDQQSSEILRVIGGSTPSDTLIQLLHNDHNDDDTVENIYNIDDSEEWLSDTCDESV